MSQEKYKILVVDDEYWIRENLRTMLDWEKYSFIFMEPAVDGEDVLSKMEKDCPDILITDINMPFINGVEVIKTVKERYPDVVIIALSGYSDFKYVRDALLAGAIDYLLKPLTKMDLINILAKALEVISRNKTLEHERESINEALLKASSLLQDKEFSMLIANDEFLMSEESAYNYISEMELKFVSFTLILIKIDKLSLVSRSKFNCDMNLLSYSIKNKIGEFVNQGKLLIFNNIFVPSEFILISDLDREYINQISQNLLKALTGFTESNINIAISNQYFYFSLKNIHTAYNEALSALMSREYCPGSSIVCIEEVKTLSIRKRITAEQEKTLIFAIQSKNRRLVDKVIFDQIGLKKCQQESWLFIEVKQTVDRIIRILTDNSGSNKSPLEILAMENLVELLYKALESCDTAEICNIMEQIIDESLGMADSYLSNESVKHIVKFVAEYIGEHYFEELSLVSLSKLFHVESSYLSRVFRKETGTNLMLYIAKKRIEKAIELINQGNLSLTEISYLVGYEDYAYFNRVFRKITGKSPSEYKSIKAREDIKESIRSSAI